jgi:hypothetical protein
MNEIPFKIKIRPLRMLWCVAMSILLVSLYGWGAWIIGALLATDITFKK